MGMYDTLEFTCPHCQEICDVQTKLGEKCLDLFKVGEETTIPPGEYRLSWGCDHCDQYAVIVIDENKTFTEVKTDPSLNAQQEVLYGNLRPIGTNPRQVFDEYVSKMKEAFQKFEESKKDKENEED